MHTNLEKIIESVKIALIDYEGKLLLSAYEE
jgi:hypothetical protein